MMRLPIAFAAAVAMSVVGVATSAQDNSQKGEGQQMMPEPPIGGIHWARDHAPARPGGGSPNLIYHGGPVMTTGAYVEPIFWGANWSNSSFVGDKITGLTTFYGTIGGSPYEATNTEYTDGNGHVGTSVTLGASHTDLSTAPRNGSHTSPILDEVCNTATSLVSNGYYPVYVDSPRGHAGYCAWHSAGTCPGNGVTVQFAFFFNLDGDPGCDPEDPANTHTQGLEALANVSGHELSEALTDQHLNAWYDSSGQENADKCAWAFGPTDLKFKNGSVWKIQGNWSNAAFDTQTGYSNRSGQLGCIDGN